MNRFMVGAAIVVGMVAPTLASAEDEPGQAPKALLNKQADVREDVRDQRPEEVERLRRLKQENPEAFQRLLEERQARLQQLKERNPEAYQRALAAFQERRKHRLQELRARDPEAFHRWVRAHQELLAARLENLKARDPDKYAQVMKRHPRFAETLQPRHEQARDRLEDVRDHREDVRERLEGGRDRDHSPWTNQGVRDWGQGEGRGGVGQGGEHRSPMARPVGPQRGRR